MNAADHEELRRDLGAYVLGALDPAERDRLEQHLAECGPCRDEIASLALLPSLLTRLGPQAVSAQELHHPPVATVVERVAAHRRRARRRERLFAAVAALGMIVALVTVGVTALPIDGTPVLTFVGDHAAVAATVEERAWGMAVLISAEQLPSRPGYVAVAVAEDGHSAQVASWTGTGGPVKVEGSCYLAPGDVERMEIHAAGDDEVLTQLQPSP
ncbi:MAG: hypothetical protein GEU74_03260 [Nitriliruptorales bacterium]|nr:hypothetical protein [Nitriliruptorales bacterium]